MVAIRSAKTLANPNAQLDISESANSKFSDELGV